MLRVGVWAMDVVFHDQRGLSSLAWSVVLIPILIRRHGFELS